MQFLYVPHSPRLQAVKLYIYLIPIPIRECVVWVTNSINEHAHNVMYVMDGKVIILCSKSQATLKIISWYEK